MLEDKIQGAWMTVGYNKLFLFHGRVFTIFDVSALSIVPVTVDSIQVFFNVFDRFDFFEDSFSMYARGGITRYTLNRLPDMQAFLDARKIGETDQPEMNFEVFWHYFNENYAFFQQRNIDWEEIYTKYRAKVTPQTTTKQLEVIFSEIVRSLNDSHVVLNVDGRELSTKQPHALVSQWQKEFHTDAFLALYPQGAQKLYQHIHQHILGGRGKSAANHLLVWGKLSSKIGYMATLAMMDLYAPFDLLHYSGFEVANVEFLQVIEQAMNEVMVDFLDLDAVIVDARFNPGGHDAVSFVIANRFADKRRLAFIKKAVQGDGYSPGQEIYLEPREERRFTGPVTLLTSQATASAAEIFVLAMMALPHVTRMGERTRGVLSDMLLKRLPNGWVVSLSNEIYQAADSNLYEGRGVPPQIASRVFYEHNFYARLGKTVDEAFAWLTTRDKGFV